SGFVVSAEQVAALPLPDHLRFNIRVVDLQGGVLVEGRDLLQLKRAAPAAVSGGSGQSAARLHRSWDFGEIASERQVERSGVRFRVYPTLRDRGNGVELTEAASEADAEWSLRASVLRLAMLAAPELHKYARKRFADEREIVLLGQGLNTVRPVPEALAELVFANCFLQDLETAPRSAESFQALLDSRRSAFGYTLDRVLG